MVSRNACGVIWSHGAGQQIPAFGDDDVEAAEVRDCVIDCGAQRFEVADVYGR
jgi:hypothetical protein